MLRRAIRRRLRRLVLAAIKEALQRGELDRYFWGHWHKRGPS